MVAKGATPPASITSKPSWQGNANKGTAFNCGTNTAGYNCSNNINPGVQDIYVRPSGYIDLVQRSDEGYQFGSIYDTDGNKKQTYFSYNDQDAGESITGNTKYTFMARRLAAMSSGEAAQYPVGSVPIKNADPAVYGANGWFGFERFLNNVTSPAHAPFNGGIGLKGNFVKITDDQNPTFNRNLNNPYPQISGMAATDTTLFVSDYLANKVYKYDAETMQKIGEFAINKPGKITIDKDGNLWIIGETNFNRSKYYTKSRDIPTRIVKYNQNGDKQSQEIYDPQLVASDIAVDSQNQLVVGDGGYRSQVFYYSGLSSTPTLVRTVGELNGLFGGAVKGAYGDYKLESISGVGVDSQDNLIVGMNEYGISKFNSSGVFQWFKHGVNWKGPGVFDPRDPKVLYTTDYKYEVDWSKPRDQWRVLAKIYDPKTFPNDYKNDQYHTGEFTTPLANSVKVCYINNQKFVIDSENNDTTMGFTKFVPSQYGELAVPAGYFHIGRPRAKINPDKNAWEEGWFWNKPGEWDSLPNYEKTLRWWSDTNDNQTRDTGETTIMTEADYNRLGNNMLNGWAREFDDDCGLWAANKQSIIYLPASGLNSSGNPIYNFANAKKFNTPSEFPDGSQTGLERFWYDKATDSAYITGWTSAKPRPNNPDLWGWNGTRMARYDNWMSGNPTKVWEQDVPFVYDPNNFTFNSTSYSTFYQVGDLIFMSRNQEPDNGRPYEFIRVYRTSDGSYIGGLDVPPDDQLNRPDGPKSMRAVKNLDGTYTVSQIDVTRAKIRLWQVTPDVLNPSSSSSAQSISSSTSASSSFSMSSTSAISSSSSLVSSVASSVASSIASSTVASSVASSVTTSTPASSSASSTPVASGAVAKKVSSPITINNTAIDTLAQGNSFVIANQISGAGAITNSADLSASFKPLWDGNNLYLSVEVKDDVVNPAGSSTLSADNQDGVEIMLDLDNSKGLTMDGMNDCKLALVYGESTANNTFGGFGASTCNTAGVETYSTLIDGGYRIDAKIPWSTLKVSPSVMDNQAIGFDIQVNDNDGGASGRDSAIGYNGMVAATIWNTPSTWGTLKLDPILVNMVNNSSNSSSSTNSNDCLI